MSTTDPNGLFAELGIEPTAPDLVEAREDEDEYQTLIMALIDLRNRRGLRQDEVAGLMHTKQSAVSRLECGLSDARYSTLQRYARALGARLESSLRYKNEDYLRTYVGPVSYRASKPSTSTVVHVEVVSGAHA